MTPEQAAGVLFEMARRALSNGPNHDSVREAGRVLDAFFAPPAETTDEPPDET